MQDRERDIDDDDIPPGYRITRKIRTETEYEPDPDYVPDDEPEPREERPPRRRGR